MSYKVIYNADDEEPNCMKCDHICSAYESFCAKCGPDNWWQNYKRTEKHDTMRNTPEGSI